MLNILNIRSNFEKHKLEKIDNYVYKNVEIIVLLVSPIV